MTLSKKLTATFLALAVAFTFMPTMPAQAAVKKPAKPVITKITKTQTKVTTTWKKAKNAKKYEFQIKRPYKTWNKYKLVKKTAKNKKTYTKKGLYKVKASGKKYQVYKYASAYTTTVTKKTKVTIKKLKADKTYKVRVRAVNGKKKSAFSKVRSVNTNSVPVVTNIEKTKFVEDNTYVIEKEGTKIEVKIEGTEDGETIGTTSAGGWFWLDPKGNVVIDNIGEKAIETNWDFDNDLVSDIWQVIIHDKDITAYWTLDGTEPKVGQKDLEGTTKCTMFPKGDNERERRINRDKGISDPNYVTQIRGTMKGKGTHGFLAGDSLTLMSAKGTRTIWTKAYKNGKLVYENKLVQTPGR